MLGGGGNQQVSSDIYVYTLYHTSFGIHTLAGIITGSMHICTT